MDFELSNEQKDIITAAREFAEGEFPEVAEESDKNEKFPRALWKKACDLGFVGVFIQEAYGGAGLGFFDDSLITEEFWRVDPGCGLAVLAATFGAQLIQLFGNETQKQRYLSPLIRGDAIMGSAITEPDAGSDVAGVATTAVSDGDFYVINGNKMFITNGTIASFVNVLCVTDPDNPNRHRRHSVIVVDTETEGFEATKLTGKLGIRASDTAEIALNNVRVPKENLIGTSGQGFKQFMEFFNVTRIHICAQAVGAAEGATEKAIAHIKNRKQFGKPLASFQVNQFKIAEMATRIEACRSLYWRAAWLLDNGTPDHRLVAMAKWFCGEMAVDVANEALQIHGGYGYLREYGVEKYYRDAKILEIYEGAKEIEKLVVARAILGKY
ncbi:MAG: acyl-CoA dehydrogenase [Nitrospiraceae bacterium]|nr:acyl-CoA dehydrogenase [Nitrospiraceae bacterium]